MKPTPTKTINSSFLLTFLTIFCLIGISSSTHAQFQIVGMQTSGPSGWTQVKSAYLSIVIPGQQPYTGQVPLDYNRQYPSGTTFTTHDNTSISVFHKGQTQVLHPNSTLKVIQEKNGIKAQTLKGKVRHVLKDAKQKVGFYRAGNGYTWAHAEGTDFTVEANSRSKAVRIATSEGRIVVTDQVPVRINQRAATQGGGRDGRELNTVVRTSNTAGQQYVTRQNSQAIVYPTYRDAIAAFEAETDRLERSGMAYYDELADSYALIGELYLDLGEYDRAQLPLAKAFEYVNALDPEDLYQIDIMLYLAESMIYGSDMEIRNTGIQMTREFINMGIEFLNESLEEYNYANKIQDYDWAWDICYDLSELNEYLGWAYELLNDNNKASYYYQWADTYDSRL